MPAWPARRWPGWPGAGAAAVCVAEVFAPDHSACQDAVAALAAELGLPVTTSSGLTGLYGQRTVTAALNASILPIALLIRRRWWRPGWPPPG